MSAKEPTRSDQEAAIEHGTQPYAALGESDAAGEEPLYGEEQWPREEHELPRRPRRRLLTPLPLSLLAVLLVAVGFIGGVLVEKGQGSSSSAGATSGSALASRFRALSGARGGASPAGAASSGVAAAGGFARPTQGTVAYLDGATLYVTDSEGATVKILTSAGTGVTKTVKSSVPAIHPGESVTIVGASSSSGVVSAELV